MKRLILTIIALIMIITGCAILAYGQEISINATTDDASVSVSETIDIDVAEEGNISFWIQTGATDISISIDGDDVAYELIGDNTYSSDISIIDLTDESKAVVSYKLSKDATEIEKNLLYNITSLTITYDSIEIYSGTNLKTDSTINIALQEEPDPQIITQTNETVPIWIYAIILILIILLIASFARTGKKQKSTKKKESIGDSQELLSTKKALLMELLKEIEKKHRAKQISDETYHKLKDKYKQDAVEAMKRLEDMKLKVK